MHTIGVDVGGTKIAAAVVTEDGAIVRRGRRDTPSQDPAGIVEAIREMVTELRSGGTGDEEVTAIGVAAAGFVDKSHSTVVFAPNLAWRDEPLRDRVMSATGLPVTVENDANAAAWGEFRFGAGRKADDMVLVTIGTGLGGGIVVDGRLLRGGFGMAAEIGHLRVVPDGRRCGCGNRGCWEQYGSGNALASQARELAASGAVTALRLLELAGGRADLITGQLVTNAANEGDPAAVELLEELGRWVGEGIASLAAVLDPELVVIGGGASQAGDLLLQPIRTAFAHHLTARGHRPLADIVVAALGNDAGLVGAADLARDVSGA